MTTAIMDARAMLASFAKSSWRTLHIRTDAAELFLARTGGGANPMRPRPAAVPAVPAPVAAAAVETVVSVTAPHVATFVSAEPVGTMVAAGQTVCRIDLLGEVIDVPAAQAGRVAGHPVAAGALVDHGQVLVTIAAG